MSENKNIELERRIVEEIVSQGKYELIPELMAPEYVLHSGGQDVQGTEAPWCRPG